MDHGVVNAALAGVVGLLARGMRDPDEWIANMFAAVRRMRNGDFHRKPKTSA